MNKKILMFIMIGMFLISFASALDSLGTYKQNQDVRITQVCSDATYINLSSVSYPNGTTAVSNVEMTYAGSGEYFYNFNKTSEVGQYHVRGISDGCTQTFATYFEVTPTGKEFDFSQGILYLGILFFLISMFGLSFYMSVRTPWEGSAGEVSYNKYMKFAYGYICYIIMVFILFMGKSITGNFLPSDVLYQFFNVFSTIAIIALGPLTILGVFFVAFSIATDKKNLNALRRGLPVETR